MAASLIRASALGPAEAVEVASAILQMRAGEQRRLDRIRKYMKGYHDRPYHPRQVREEYREIERISKVNYLPLVVSVISQNLHVDGYRPTPPPQPKPTMPVSVTLPSPPQPSPPAGPTGQGTSGERSAALPAGGSGGGEGAAPNGAPSPGQSASPSGGPAAPGNPLSGAKVEVPPEMLYDDTIAEENNPVWDCFIQNGLVSGQHGLHRSVAKYGLGYMLVLPGSRSGDTDCAMMRPYSPRRMTAMYQDYVNDDYPQYALEFYSIITPKGAYNVVVLYDDTNIYTMMGDASTTNLTVVSPGVPGYEFLPSSAIPGKHGMGVCPVVRFRHEIDLDGELDVAGEVEPLIPVQDQINTITYHLMMAAQYAAFRQRWVSGMVTQDEYGRQRAPFRPGVDRLWVADDPTTKFGEFSATDLTPYLKSREESMKHLAITSQVPPYHMLGLVANLSAEALAAARDGLDRKIDELEAVLTHPWLQAFQLSGHADGNEKAAKDWGAQVVWRDSSARAFSSTVDGLGKMSQMLGVPPTELWEKIPGVSAAEVSRWKQYAQRPGFLEQLNDALELAYSKGTQDKMPGQPGGPSYEVYEAKPTGI